MKYITSFKDFVYENYENDYLKMSDEDKELLLKYDKELHEVLTKYEREHVHFANVKNTKSEIKKYLDGRKIGKPHKIKLEYEDNKFLDDLWCKEMIDTLDKLKEKFVDIDCYLTKFYVYRIEETIEHIEFFNKYMHDDSVFPKTIQKPSVKLYNKALEYLSKYKYQNIKELAEKDGDYKRVYTPEESRKRLQKIIDEKGLGWKVVIDKNMIPRMSVRPYREFRINADNNFSEVDLQSLEVHEIEVHTARKANALKTGLYLFLYGLEGDNIFDEGLAIYNSLNKTKKQKPNILFFISIKIVILYHLYDMDFDKLFDFLLQITGAPEDVIVLALIRAMRVFSFNLYRTAYTDTDYLDGYERVKDMDDKLRKDLLEYPIGPNQLYELNTIRKFFEINKFKPL